MIIVCKDSKEIEVSDLFVQESDLLELVNEPSIVLDVDYDMIKIINDFYEMRSKISEVDDIDSKQITVPQDKEFMEQFDRYVVRDLANTIDLLRMKYIARIVCKKLARIMERITDVAELYEFTGVQNVYEDEQMTADRLKWFCDDQ